jgi:hypothetical protein
MRFQPPKGGTTYLMLAPYTPMLSDLCPVCCSAFRYRHMALGMPIERQGERRTSNIEVGNGVDTDDVEAASAIADRRTHEIDDDELAPFDVARIVQN